MQPEFLIFQGRVLITKVPGYKWLGVIPGKRGGRPVIKGTHVSVDDILEARSSVWSIEEVAENHRVPEKLLEKLLSMSWRS